MWFDSWSDVIRVLLVGTAAYVTVVVVLRLSGKRTLTKLNAFDLVVTVALGSTLATILLSTDVAWTEGAVALGLLALLQAVVAWATVRWPGLRMVVTSRPTLVLRNGEPVHDRMREVRVGIDEIRQAIRSSGSGDLADVAAVVLESDGSLSVIPAKKYGAGSALAGVAGTDDIARRAQA
ncbi:DUF421 domain-containing protein [Blastococcus sp. VKM Ac-2987]|uniref:DUF421 domain-containing protein n=1 Tax=Blastococcus sp. VKM Ac-2987 TaxID=3004141 RepID=UPI0022ABB696|nr:YetF domain-containing protein [Blastococcus sp. VKM Ac-2987]MCZ2860436.1 DUF421 domain-containing protein [Blastococcus sp. VKM Ac-2987]